MQEINLKLTIDETNVILEALGTMPYSKVFKLVEKIHQQASSQLNAGNPNQAMPEQPAAAPKA